MAGQRELIGHQLQALYKIGQQSPLRLLLNQSHAESVSRHLRYYDYFFSARRDMVSHYVSALQRQKAVEAQIRQSMVELQSMQVASEQEHASLLAIQNNRKQLLVSMDKTVSTKSGELKQLERDRSALQKVIDQIEQQRTLAFALEQKRQANILAAQQKQASDQQKAAKEPAKAVTGEPETLIADTKNTESSDESQAELLYSSADMQRLQSTSFKQRKGVMPWPVKGSVEHRFGDPRQGSISWEGLRILAKAGTDVRAVHYGRVVYADWLRGQGMLVILDHGDGYMSLYAHNDVLLHSQGEWVQAGDSIARVGNSGGEKEAGLYFEIRQAGRTVDPATWLGQR
jgi:septal ring factor EnvC (AmiA/AmiB activator)